jgi:hypothetical protein
VGTEKARGLVDQDDLVDAAERVEAATGGRRVAVVNDDGGDARWATRRPGRHDDP